jgi:starch synthase (maltosyl-transferring)
MPDTAPGRVVIENVLPDVDAGRFPLARCVGDVLRVSADLFADGHDHLSADLIVVGPHGRSDAYPMTGMGFGIDRFESAPFAFSSVGTWKLDIHAWIDSYSTWLYEIVKKFEAGVSIELELREGLLLIDAAIANAERTGRANMAEEIGSSRALIADADVPLETKVETASAVRLATLMREFASRESVSTLEGPRLVRVDRERAVFGAWYETFPRSTASEPGRHGTFRDLIRRLDAIAGMGFDILYLPPIHPIGQKFRKGPNNSLEAGPGDPGSPWAIGSELGGHTAIHPELGTLADFRDLVEAAQGKGMEIALDIAFQCSPDHPWLTEHPDWFRIRPDGSIRYAENPPKKYQDIHPLNFESDDWRNLWNALRDVFLYWAAQGVKVFRVDNPHTKPFPFWEWCLEEVRREHPDAIFLSEAFTRPKLMKRLAKAGFTQSYTYFTWRNDKQGLTDYFTELTRTECREYLRPNLFANTPDILHAYLQNGGPAAFRIRLILAATLGATYGIYGPPYELCENAPAHPGSEEYLHSEKYEIRTWDHDNPGDLSGLIRRINHIRRSEAALHRNDSLTFHATDSPELIAYSKITEDRNSRILVVVNLDPHHTRAGFVSFPLSHFDLSAERGYAVHDLLNGDIYRWYGDRNYVELSPERSAHVFRIEE